MSDQVSIEQMINTMNLRLSNLEMQNQQLIGQNQELLTKNHDLASKVSVMESKPRTLSTTTLTPKVKLPDPFDGSRTKLRGFLNQLELVFRLQPDRYRPEDAKIFTCVTLLVEKALAWFNPIMERPELYAKQLNDWTSFKTSLTTHFGDLDKAVTASNAIRRLVQGSRSASVYAAEFQELAADLDWNDSALRSQFHEGLAQKIKEMLLGYPETINLSSCIDIAIRSDNRYRETLSAYRNPSPHQTPNRTPTVHGNVPQPARPSDAMEIDAIQSSTSQRRPPLTQEERHRRFQNGLCLVCGASGHVKLNCPSSYRNRAPTLAAIGTATAPTQNPPTSLPQDFSPRQ
jgi:hypothetical protein